jgi:hypothetical protein
MGVDCLADCGVNYPRLWLTAAVLGYGGFALGRRYPRSIVPVLFAIAIAVRMVTSRDHYGWTSWAAGITAAVIALAGVGRIEAKTLLAVTVAGFIGAAVLLAMTVRWRHIEAVPLWLLWLQAPGVVAEIERSTPYAQLPGWSWMVVGPNGLVYSAFGALASAAWNLRARRTAAMGAPFAS